MFLTTIDISPASFVKDVVLGDHRTADVFEKYGIGYCCGAKWSLATTCEMQEVNFDSLMRELKLATQIIQLPSGLDMTAWPVDFLADYILHVHHVFLQSFLPSFQILLERFVQEHAKRNPALIELQVQYRQLSDNLPAHLLYEQEQVLPYVRQLDHAYRGNDRYAKLLVKTMQKRLEKLFAKGERFIPEMLSDMRELTAQYLPPANACTSHRVVWAKLKELDIVLSQYHHIRMDILFVKVCQMEKALLDE